MRPQPLWSPAFGAGKTTHSDPAAGLVKVPLWSPAFGAGKTSRGRWRTRARRRCRYGARPSGPGRLVIEDLHVAGMLRPLWSPAFGAGKTTPGGRRSCRCWRSRYGARPSGPGRPVHPRGAAVARLAAAMEPGLRGREDDRPGGSGASGSGRPLWSPAFGAGKTGQQVQPPPQVHAGRYGARPSGPGRLLLELLRHPRHVAAMEPGLRGREDRGCASSPAPS